jgi:hypothetical protein
VSAFEPDVSQWEPWRPEQVAELLAGVELPWYVGIEWTEDGIPYGRPEIVLLFKARHASRAKNQADFEAALPRLDVRRREWLRSGLERVHPRHAWIAQLQKAAA